VRDLLISGPVVVDGFGDLLVPAYDGYKGVGRGVVYRFTPAGERSVFASGFTYPCSIGVGPDGDVWIGEYGDAPFRRYDPLGQLKDTLRVPYVTGGPIRFSADGALYYQSQGGIQRIENGVAVDLGRWQTYAPFAVDRDGYVYAMRSGDLGYRRFSKVVVMDPQGQIVVDPFAYINGVEDLVFMTEPGGAGTKRLLGVASQDSTPCLCPPQEIVEFNSAGVRAPGPPAVPSFTHADVSPLRVATVAMPYVDTLQLAGGSTPSTWTIVNGALPAGLSLSQSTGVISGSPTDAGSFSMTVRAGVGAADALSRVTLTVAAPTFTVLDITNALLGGAALPPTVVAFLDRQGNNNGTLDVGDLRAYLRALGQLR
jgi:hypothetical protein